MAYSYKKSIVEILQSHSQNNGNKSCCTFLLDGDNEALTLTFKDLDSKARNLANYLQQVKAYGKRAVLMYPFGPDYVIAFMACLYAGTIPVPAYVPRKNRSFNRLENITYDSQSDFILTTSVIQNLLSTEFKESSILNSIPLINTNTLNIHNNYEWVAPIIREDSIAFLQYTSGSTGLPKGVMVSHGNIVHNQFLIKKGFGHTKKSVYVSWLPLFHDMGLIGTLLQAIYSGMHCVLMSPESFSQKPLRWLLAISKYKATTSGGPNFAYELCVESIDLELLKDLDLRSWRVAYNGAEPIRFSTLERFAEKFSPFGFKFESFYPCYGMAEATLMITGGSVEAKPTTIFLDKRCLENNFIKIISIASPDVKAFVSCGYSDFQDGIKVVDRDTLTACTENQIGEVWVNSQSVAKGYWNRPTESLDTFGAHLKNNNNSFLRTGDLAFINNGHLYITGRAKDLIIIRGANYYPQDIEYSIESCHPHLRTNHIAAFSIDIDGEEKLVIAQELKRTHLVNFNGPEIVHSIRNIVASQYELQVHSVLLLKTLSIPKTSSGKIQRSSCRNKYLTNSLDVIYSHTITDSLKGNNEVSPPSTPAEQLLVEIWQQVLGRAQVGIQDNFFELGGDSIKAIQIVYRLQQRTGTRLGINDLFAYPRLSQLVDFLEQSQPQQWAPIPQAPQQASYPLSPQQRQLWLANQLELSSAAYNIPGAYWLEGDLNREALEEAFQLLIERHHSLRTRFIVSEGEPRQQVVSLAAFQLPYQSLSQVPQLLSQEQAVQQLAFQQATQVFQLDQAPLVRAQLLGLGERKYVLLLTLHHIISDGWSMGVLLTELAQLYNACLHQQSTPLSPLPLQYKDYQAWQHAQLTDQEHHKAYWLAQFSSPVVPLQLSSFPRPAVKTYPGQTSELRLPVELTARLTAFGQKKGVSLFTLLLTGVQVLLGRYSGQPDIVVGIPVAGRDHVDLESQIGFYANTIALRTQLEWQESFEGLLERISQHLLAAYQHQAYPLGELLQELNLVRDPSRTPLFDVLVNMQDRTELTQLSTALEGLCLRSEAIESNTSKFDLTFDFSLTDQQVVLNLNYNTDLFTRWRIEQLLSHFQQLLASAVATPHQPISQLELLSPQERHQLVEEFNQTQVSFDQQATIVSLFEAQVARTPQAVAVVFQERQLTYQQLNQQANQLAHHLRAHYQLEPDQVVGLLVDRSERMLIGLLGILKAGAAYLPLDPAYPAERLSYMLADAQPRVVLVEGRSAGAPADYLAGQSLCWLDEPTRFGDQLVSNPELVAQAHQLAYIIYTSGSTGKPKGVMIEHQSVVNLSLWLSHLIYQHHTQPLVALLTASINFDASVQQLFAPLFNGSQLVLIPESSRQDPKLYWAALKKYQVNIIDITPTYLDLLLGVQSIESPVLSLAYTLVGGEALTADINKRYQQVFGQQSHLINVYGITEVTVDSSVEWEVGNPETVHSIGRPIANTQLYVLDEHQQLLPLGISGEICISGAGLARGYLHQPQLTQEKFVNHPFRPGEKLYRTGDLGRWRADGTLEYLGRKDSQIKLRGYRIELGEIEQVLLTHPDVQQAVVLLVNQQGGQLAACVVGLPTLTPSELRSFLLLHLPPYMVPASFTLLESLPLNTSGKTDRKALMSLVEQHHSQELLLDYLPPSTPAEQLLVEIWQQVLGRAQVGIQDNFFELGGDSIKAIQIVYRLQQRTGTRLGINDLFAYPRLSQLVDFLEQSQPQQWAPIPQAPQQASYPLSPQQRQLWLANQLELSSAAYNIPGAYWLEGDLNREALEEAFQLLIERHHSLRTRFIVSEGEPRQQVVSLAAFQLPYQSLSQVPQLLSQEQAVQQLAFQQATQVFQLDQAPLVRAQLLGLGERKYVLLLTLHHIISDGWSMGVLLTELAQLYNACLHQQSTPLSPLPLQYKDYQAWQHAQLTDQEHHKAYWLAQFSSPVVPLQLSSFPRPAVKTYPGQTSELRLPVELTARLTAFGQKKGVSLFTLLLTGVQVLLGRYSGQPDIVVGIPVAGRDHVDLESQIGFYANTIALRTQLEWQESFEGLLERISQHLLAAYQHQAYPLGELLQELNLVRDPSRTPLFDVLVNMQDRTELTQLSTALEGLCLRSEAIESNTSKFDLTFDFSLTDQQVVLNLNYNTDLFTRWRIEQLLSHFQQLLASAVATPHQPISQLELLSPQERHQLVEEFNQTQVSFDQQATIVSLFEAQVARTPQAVAVVFQERQLTYQQLNQQANQLAHHLRAHYQLEPDQVVGLLVDRSERMLIGLLGILKAGAAYLPLDPAYPAERLSYMLADAQPRVVLVEGRSAGAPADYLAGQSLCWLDEPTRFGDQLVSNPELVAQAHQLAYIIYTSGSTGKPKGVMIPTDAIVHYLQWANQYYFRDRSILSFALFTSLSFDLTQTSIFTTLLRGGTLHVFPQQEILDSLAAIFSPTSPVTCVKLTPSHLSLLPVLSLPASNIAQVIVGGEKLLQEQVDILSQLNLSIELYNEYGPTEATVGCAVVKVGNPETVHSIGRPIANTQLYVLDEHQQLLPLGISGEICISGAGLARGYLHQPQLTQEKFVNHPFRPGEKLYRTGDLGRWRADGTLEYLGRKDSQIKLRGYRIELGEIEQVLLTHPDVQQAVVLLVNQQGEQLAACVVGLPTLTPSELRSFLLLHLPPYMVPASFTLLESLPLNTSGKTDRKALMSLVEQHHSQELLLDYLPPSTPAEQLLVEIWQQVLGRAQVGIQDNFFELGGDSIKAIQIVYRLQQRTGTRLGINDLFAYPRLSQLVDFLEQSQPQQWAPIPQAPQQASYPLSPQQRQLWLANQLELSSAAYNIPGAYWLEGDLNREALEEAFQLLIERHHSLRTRFIVSEGEPRQQVVSLAAFQLPYQSLSQVPQLLSQEQAVQQLAFQQATQVFQLDQAPLVRAQLLGLGERKYVLLLTLHHIISDGWSMGVLLTELAQLYNACLHQQSTPLSPLPLQYKDYQAWQHAQLTDQEHHKAYWLAQFSSPVVPLQLSSFPRPAVKTYPGQTSELRLPVELTARLTAFGQKKGVSLFTLLLTGVQVLLGRYSGQPDIVVGIPVAGRDHVDLESQIGFYANTIALRTQLEWQESFEGLLERISQHLLAAYQHQAYPLGELLQELNLVRDPSRTPLFDVLVNMQDRTELTQLSTALEGLCLRSEAIESNTSKFDLTFDFSLTDQQVVLNLNYNTDLFTRWRIEQLLSHFQQLLASAVATPHQPISQLELLSPQERHQLVEEFNQTQVSFDQQATIVSLFEAQVARTPQAVAVVFQERQLTYQQLNQQANQLAHHLRAHYQLEPDQVVGLLVDRSERMLIGLLGILKAGAAYLPLDPAYPAERLSYMLADAQPRVVLVEGRSAGAPADYLAGQSLCWLDEPTRFGDQLVSNPELVAQAHQLAYIIYTSGSTGKPKGVMIEHQSVVNFLAGMELKLGEQTSQKWLALNAFTFDIFGLEVFLPLIKGAQLILVSQKQRLDFVNLAQFIQTQQPSFLQATPTVWTMLIENGWIANRSLTALSGGETLPAPLAHQLLDQVGSLWNLYGPTETTIWSGLHRVSQSDVQQGQIPIGRPIANTQLYVLDEHQQLLPLGISGEICISGAGLARGYLHQPQLTQEKFVNHPFRPGEKLYRTGDLGRWRADGTLEYLGRKDSQIKLRGYRIELGEIEQVLLTHPDVQQAVVLLVNQQGEQLAACVVGLPTLTPSELRSFLLLHLPPYMVPASFTLLESLPLNTSGKTDRKALMSLVEQHHSQELLLDYLPPSTPAEQLLVEIWQQVLGRAQVGIQDNFFELGGDSIKAIQIVSRAYRAGYQLQVRDIFQSPTPQALAPALELLERVADQTPVVGELPLTPIQTEFFALPLNNPHHFNQAVLLQSQQPLAPQGLVQVFTRLLVHHDALRLRFPAEHQAVNLPPGDQPFNLVVHDLRQQDQPQAVLQHLCEQLQRSLDLQQGPLVAAALFELADSQRLLIVVHHLVIDGISWRILLEDIGTLYQQWQTEQDLVLPLKTDSFQHWAIQLAAYAQSPACQSERTYWESLRLETIPPLPRQEGPPGLAGSGFTLSPAETALLLGPAQRAYHTEVNDLLLSALAVALQRVYGQDRYWLTLEGHGREPVAGAVDVSRTVGWFTTTYPVVLTLQTPSTSPLDWGHQLKATKENLRAIPHKGIGYGLLRYLQPVPPQEGVFSASSQLVFNYLGQFDTDLQQSHLSAAAESGGATQGADEYLQYDLSVTGLVTGEQLHVQVAYDTARCSAARAQALGEAYQQALQELIHHCVGRSQSELTPSDLTYTQLSLDQLAGLRADYPQLEDVGRLTPMQEGMLFHGLLEPSSSAYFVQISYHLGGRVSPRLVEQSLNALFARHQVLRTAFVHQNSEVLLQVVLKDRQVDFHFEDLRTLEPQDQAAYCLAYKQADKQRSFDLSRDVLMRVSVLQLADEQFEFVWSNHHILMDGWCAGVLIQEFIHIYAHLQAGNAWHLPPVVSFSRYLQWLNQQPLSVSQTYWQTYLRGYEQVASLPKKSRTRPGYVVGKWSVSYSREQTQAVQRLAASQQVTLNTVVQALWGVLLSKYNQGQEVVFGAVVSGRSAPLTGIETMVGLFINTVPVRIKVDPQASFVELLQGLQREALASEAHHHYPLAQIQAESALKQHLLDHILVFENYPLASQLEGIVDSGESTTGWQVSDASSEEQTNYDLELDIFGGEELRLKWQYNQLVYEPDQIERLASQFSQLLASAVATPHQPISQLELLSPQERHQLVEEFNQTQVSFDQQATIVSLFEAQVARTPQAVAVVFQERQLTYQQLNQQANQLAHHLRAHYQLEPDQVVGLLVDRSERMLIGLLGILKAGAAYLPLDPAYPAERLSYMLADAQPRVVLSDSEYVFTLLDYYSGPLLALDIELDTLVTSVSNPELVAQAHQLAYIIYTSGSTGKPKGVMIPTDAIVHYLQWANQYYFRDRSILSFALFTSLSFDLTQTSIFTTLLRGGTLHVFPQQEILDSLAAIFSPTSPVTCVKLTPSHLSLLPVLSLPASNIAQVIVGGEKLLQEQVDILSQLNLSIELYNEYGPTEATVGCAVVKVGNPETVHSIGRPIANTQLYVLDEHQQLLPLGISGEICISGAGLARGYLHQPQLTQEKFVNHPFRPGEKLYRTGDLGRWRADGTLEYLGRKDSQIKLRGYRIELGEIEQVLLTHPDVQQAVVLLVNQQGGQLAACVVGLPTLTPSELRSFLLLHLPPYMVPASFTLLESLPLNTSGKTDRKALMSLVEQHHSQELLLDYLPPSTPAEQLLVEIWQQVLGRAQVGIQDNFFELGGDSIKAIQIVYRLQQRTGTRLGINDLFAYPRLSQLVDFLEQSQPQQWAPIPQAPQQASYPLSPQQRQLWLANQLELSSAAYNIPGAYWLEGDLNREALEEAFQLLIERHHSLRTRFIVSEGEPRQLICPLESNDFKIQYLDLESEANKEVIAINTVKLWVQTPFNLEQDLLIRVMLIHVNKKKHLLGFVIHHIATDEWSMRVLFKNLIQIYHTLIEGAVLKLDPLHIQYKDYSVWQNTQLHSGFLKESREFWVNQFIDGVPILRLPTDYVRPQKKTFDGDIMFCILTDETSEKIKYLSQASGVTMFVTLLASLKTLLALIANQDDIVFGIPIIGRDHEELEDQIGFYVNNIALRSKLNFEESFSSLIGRMNILALDAFKHQSYPVDFLIDDLNIKRDQSRSWLYDTGFTWHEYQDLSALSDIGLEAFPIAIHTNTAKADIWFHGKESFGKIEISIEYNINLFVRESIILLMERFKNLLNHCLNNPLIKLKDINLKTDIEREIEENIIDISLNL